MLSILGFMFIVLLISAFVFGKIKVTTKDGKILMDWIGPMYNDKEEK
jgi:hypothetical protein